MKPVVSCRGVARDYASGELTVHALVGVDLDLMPGEFASLSGPSGSGKTTLLNIIGGLDSPTAGEVYVDGERIDGMSKGELAELRLRKIGFVFQSYNLIPVLSASENVQFVMQLQGVDKAQRIQQAEAMLAAVGLGGLGDRRPGELSGGQQQRVAVARAVVGGPKLVLADEPTANLDSATARSLMELMRKMNEDLGVTFIFSTHDKIVMEYARRLIQLHDGRIVSDAPERS